MSQTLPSLTAASSPLNTASLFLINDANEANPALTSKKATLAQVILAAKADIAEGDLSAKHFVSTLTDGTVQYRLVRTGTNAREYGLAISAANGEFLIDDLTAATSRLRISTAGVATIAGGLVGTPIGASSPSTGAFTTLTSNSTTTFSLGATGVTDLAQGFGLRVSANPLDTAGILQFTNYAQTVQWASLTATNGLLTAASSLSVSGDVSGAHFVSTLTDGTSQYELVRTGTNARRYGLAISGATGEFLVDDNTVNETRLRITTSGVATIAGGLVGTPIGASSPSTGAFTTLSATGSGVITGGASIGQAAFQAVGNQAGQLIANLTTSITTAGQSFGLRVAAGTNASDYALRVSNQAGTLDYLYVKGDGTVSVGKLLANGSTTDYGLESVSYLTSGGWNYGLRVSDNINATMLLGVRSGRAVLQTDAASLDFAAGNVVYATLSSSGFAVTGAVTASNLSGTNTGDQTITLTGDVTGSGTGSFATTIGAGKVTNAMLAGSIDLTTKVAGVLPIANGGTGAATAPAALTALGAYPASNPSGYTTNTGTVTSVSVVTANGVSGSVADQTTTPAITLTLGDISAATSKPAVTGSVLRSFESRAGDVFNVKDFGATGGGSVDDAAAIQLAVDAAVTKTRAVVYFPSGRYLVGTAIDTNGNYGGRISFVGAGEFGSVLVANTAGMSVFSPTLGSGFAGVEFRHLSFETNTGITADACVTQTTVPGSQSKVVLDSLLVSGDYVNGFLLSQVGYGKIDGVDATAALATYDSGSGAGSGSAISLTGYCLNNVISNVRAVYWKNGLLVGDGTNTWQGLEITNFNTVFTVYGIKMTGQTVSPDCGAVQMSNVEIDAGNAGSQSAAYGIWSNYVSDIQITNSTTYTNAAGAKVGVYMANRSEAVITNMRLVTSGSTSGIQLVAMSNVIVSDILQGGFTNTISLDASCSYCRVRGAQTLSSTASAVSDSGANNSIECSGSLVWDPSSLTPGQQDTTTLSVPGVVFGSTVSLGVPYDLQGLTATASVYTAGVVRITVYNSTTLSTIDLGSGTWRIRAITPGP